MRQQQRSWLAVFALWAWLAVGMATPASTTTQADQTAAFDILFRHLEETELATLPSTQVPQRLDDLARLRPANDNHRDLLYRALRCDWGFDDNVRAQLDYAQAGLVRALANKDGEAQARFHYCHAAALEILGSTDKVMAAYEAGIAVSRRIGNDRLLADGLSMRGSRYSLLGDQARAVPDLLAAQRLYRRGGFKKDAEFLLLDIAISYRRIGEFVKAREYLQQNETFVIELGDWSQLIGNLMQQGYLAEDQDRIDDAQAIYERALKLAQAHSSRYYTASVHLAMTYPWILRGDYPRALELLKTAQSEFDALGDRANDDMLALRRGQARAGLGQHALALTDYRQAATALERSGNRRYLALLYRARAHSEHALGKPESAYADLERYIDVRGTIVDAERTQQAQLLRTQFDSDRRNFENERMVSEKILQERQLQALLQARRWQWTALVLGGVLVVLLAALIMRQLVRMRRLRELASTDPLTGVANRRSIELLGENAIVCARRAGNDLCALTLDVDHFKQVNDRYGHLTGDQVLARIARACHAALRQVDSLGRTGGEEFLVLLPHTSLEEARPIADRLRVAVASIDFSDIDAALTITMSIGMAALRPQDAHLRDLLARSDAALYQAKRNGRNRVEKAV